MTTTTTMLCPSATAQAERATVFAVVAGSVGAPRAVYLDRALPLDASTLALAGDVAPTEVLRIASACAGSGCHHFDAAHDHCALGTQVVRHAPVVVHKLPRCAIRRDCRWWHEQGSAACTRCPQIATATPLPAAVMA